MEIVDIFNHKELMKMRGLKKIAANGGENSSYLNFIFLFLHVTWVSRRRVTFWLFLHEDHKYQ